MKRTLVLHTCCAPCLCYVEKKLHDSYNVISYHFNPNIHPYLEYEKRTEALVAYTKQNNISLIEELYDIALWFDYVLQEFGKVTEIYRHKEKRCALCYMHRLEKTAQFACAHGYSVFSTTLLYSIHQAHDVIKACGDALGERYGLRFLYQDFREGWQPGIDQYKTTGLYRQKYCGCLMSMEQRFRKAHQSKYQIPLPTSPFL